VSVSAFTDKRTRAIKTILVVALYVPVVRAVYIYFVGKAKPERKTKRGQRIVLECTFTARAFGGDEMNF
jgi:hypothetical protein